MHRPRGQRQRVGGLCMQLQCQRWVCCKRGGSGSGCKNEQRVWGGGAAELGCCVGGLCCGWAPRRAARRGSRRRGGAPSQRWTDLAVGLCSSDRKWRGAALGAVEVRQHDQAERSAGEARCGRQRASLRSLSTLIRKRRAQGADVRVNVKLYAIWPVHSKLINACPITRFLQCFPGSLIFSTSHTAALCELVFISKVSMIINSHI